MSDLKPLLLSNVKLLDITFDIECVHIKEKRKKILVKVTAHPFAVGDLVYK